MDWLLYHRVLIQFFSISFVMGLIAQGDFLVAPGVERVANMAELTSPAKKAIESAQQAIRDRNLKAARESLNSLAADPNVAHPEILLSELLSEAGFEADARNVLEELSGKEPQRADLYLAFCDRAVKQQRWFDGWNLANIGLRGSMPEHWSEGFRKHVQDRLQLLKAICCEGRQDWKTAKEIYTSIEQNSKDNVEILAGSARSSFHLGETDAALEYFGRIKEINPKSEPPHLLLAQLNDLVGKTDKAESAYKQALETAAGRDKVGVRLAFARWFILQNRPEPIADLLTEPITDSPDDEVERQFLQALLARMEGRYGDSQVVLSALHRQNPNRFVIANQLALVLCESSDESLRARALQLAEGNVRNQSQSSEAWATLGWVQFRLGDRSAAENSLANAAKLGQMSRDTLYYIWQIKQAAGDLKAAALLEKAFLDAKGPNYFAKQPTVDVGTGK